MKRLSLSLAAVTALVLGAQTRMFAQSTSERQKVMPNLLQRSLVTTVALLSLVTVTSRPLLAQTLAEEQAQTLLLEADSLADTSESVDSVLAAYERALNAYRPIDSTDVSLSIFSILTDLNYVNCRDPQAVDWAIQALQFIEQQQPDDSFNGSQHFNNHGDWSQRLGDLYRANNQPDQALAAYDSGLDYRADWPQSATVSPNLVQMATLLQSQLSLLAPDSDAAEEIQEQLVATWQQAGAVTEVDGLLSNAERLAETDTPAPALLAQALDSSRRHRYPAGELRALLLSGQAAIDGGDYDDASDYAQQAIELTKQLQYGENFEDNALYVLAQAEWGKGNLQAAIDHYTTLQEMVDTQSLTMDVNRFEIVTSLTALYQQTGQMAQAQTLIDRYANQSAIPRLRVSRSPFRFPRLVGTFNAVLPHRTCDQPETETSPFLVPSLPVRRPGRGIRMIPHTVPRPTPIRSQPSRSIE
ncbi:tetratricopeptide repeat protein [Leptolyngbya cf. ectocarpi LEGE 11479]|uniref:Tetratricopeptide repeat protein n=1 Tax=Leptolyngbya cf. ectocarpi LEGE 11479 TaxID=1828722 RepID=A0A929FBI0_LEPEC|nr:tetratricopeptide repeat protein [Leptolyngbya ectocarpi]MBE9069009.1 tetratricopeptide repeat protein [Leptolyngbya cf. ectocarpi LEGE 11479]